MRCSSCGFGNPERARFCAGCGTGLAQSCPACGFPVQADHHYCAACGVDGLAEGFGGTVDKHIGDCVMAVFGAPVATGNDPERAARAALEAAIGAHRRETLASA